MVKKLHRSLLGKPAIEHLNILARIGSIKKPGQSVLDHFSHLFRGLGKLEEDYTIRKERSHSLSPPLAEFHFHCSNR